MVVYTHLRIRRPLQRSAVGFSSCWRNPRQLEHHERAGAWAACKLTIELLALAAPTVRPKRWEILPSIPVPKVYVCIHSANITHAVLSKVPSTNIQIRLSGRSHKFTTNFLGIHGNTFLLPGAMMARNTGARAFLPTVHSGSGIPRSNLFLLCNERGDYCWLNTHDSLTYHMWTIFVNQENELKALAGPFKSVRSIRFRQDRRTPPNGTLFRRDMYRMPVIAFTRTCAKCK